MKTISAASVPQGQTTGWPQGHDPHPLFSVQWYLERYPDVAKAGTEPLSHYLKHGGTEVDPGFGTGGIVGGRPFR
jgi:hypothetical protein